MNTSAQRDLPPRPYIASEDGSMQIAFSPDLAAALGGIGQSIFLRQLAFWIRNDQIDFYNPHIIFANGLWWIRQSSEDMARRLKGCIKPRTLRGYIDELIQQNVIVATTEFNAPLDRTHWLALVPQTVTQLPGIEYVIPIGKISQSIGEICQSEPTPPNGADKPHSDPAPIGEICQSVIYIQESEEAPPNQIQEGEASAASAAPPTQTTIMQTIDFWAVKEAIATACQLDPVLRDGMIGKYAKHIASAGYGPEAILTAVEYWYQVDWRGKKGDIPRIDELIDTLPKAREWKQSLTDSTSAQYDPWEGKKGDYSDYYEVQA